jgi:mannose-6-phosphate isomerase
MVFKHLSILSSFRPSPFAFRLSFPTFRLSFPLSSNVTLSTQANIRTKNLLFPCMQNTQLYPLKFDPIYQYRIWGGRRLQHLLTKPLPKDDPIGEAWILSDRDDHPSVVSNGALQGQTIKQLLKHSAKQLMGPLADKFERFPLLLKFLDCKQVLSVQVHPSDEEKKYIPKGEHGKTESWVVLETGKKARIYAGLKDGTTPEKIRDDLKTHTVGDDLAGFSPEVGECVLIKAGTVHTLGDVVVFEVQENSDVTYRLYDWDRIDEKTGKPRDLQVEEALACIDFSATNVKPVKPEVLSDSAELREKLAEDEHFTILRHTGSFPFLVGKDKEPRILVGVEGKGELEYQNEMYHFKKGEVILLPAMVGACTFIPKTNMVMLEIVLPG